MSDKSDARNTRLRIENPQIQNFYQKSNHFKPGYKLLIYHFILFSFFWETQQRKKK